MRQQNLITICLVTAFTFLTESVAFAGLDVPVSSDDGNFVETGGSLSEGSVAGDINQYLLQGTKSHEEKMAQRKRIKLSEKQKKELRAFYTNTDFPKGLWQEIHSKTKLASNGDAVSEIKEVLPGACDRVIDKVASTVRDNVTEVHLNGPTDVIHSCPNWNKLSVDQKKDFYVALVTAMALAESSCNNNIKARGTNSTAYGLWQGTKRRTPTQGAEWVMNQIESQINQSGKLFWSDSKLNYWAVLNPNIHAYKVQNLLKKIPTCVSRLMTDDLF